MGGHVAIWLCVVAWTGTQMRVAAQTLAQSHTFDCNDAGPGQTALFKCVGVVAALFALSAMLGENGKLVCYCIMAGIIMQVTARCMDRETCQSGEGQKKRVWCVFRGSLACRGHSTGVKRSAWRLLST